MAEYIIPKECEMCGSGNVVARVLYDSGITRYVCNDCGFSRSLPKERNLRKRTNTSLNNWANQVIKHRPFCEICGAKDNLEAHHIIPVAHSKKYAYAVVNGMTLCRDHHYLVHHREAEGDDG